ncbi:MAG TPA: hypothetical protein VFN03_08235, partial [Trueperaceae bacterium]|nr:hypothetical protein [Trueperaceae bacterium]
ERDELEAASLYDLIEHQVAPRFYDRNDDGIPTRWVESIRHTLSSLSPALSADRMVREYVERLYIPAASSASELTADSAAGARDLAAWKAKVVAAWPSVTVSHVESGGVDAVPEVGDELHVRARIQLDGLSFDDVSVELVYGFAHSNDELVEPQRLELTPDETAAANGGGAGLVQFGGTVTLNRAGSFGYTVRVTPRHPGLASDAELGLVATAVGSDRA